MWTVIVRIILRNRILLLVALGIITAFMAYKASFVQFTYEFSRLLPESDTTYVQYQDFKALFGEDGNIMAIGIEDSNFYEINKFNDWYDLGNSIKQIDGIKNIVSVAHISNLYKNKEQKKFEIKPVFISKPKTQAELDSLSEIIQSLPFYKNILYNDSSHTFLMAITLSKEKLNTRERVDLVKNIKDKANLFANKYQLKIHLSGLPYIRTVTTEKIKAEMVMFIILAMLLTIIILYLFFRSIRVIFFSSLVVAIAVVWTFGSMALFDYKITMLTGLIPCLLIVIGIANCIFLINKYHFEYRNHRNKTKALQRVIQKIGNATFLTNLTTAMGFATFIITSSAVLVEFGIIASINIMGVFILSLLLIPIFISFLPPPSKRHTRHLENILIRRIIDKLIYITTNRRKIVYIVSIIIVLLGFVGITLMKSTGYIVDDIPHKDPIYVDLKFFEKHFIGVMPLEITIDTKKKKGALKLPTLKKIDRLQDSLKMFTELSRPVSLTEAVKFSRQAYYNGNEKCYNLPNDMDKNFIMAYSLEEKNKYDLLRLFIDSTGQVTRVSVQMADVGTKRMKELYNKIRKDIDSIFSSDKYNVTLTGFSVIFFKGTKYLIKNLFISLSLAVILIAFFMAVMFASRRMLLVSLIPNLIPLLLTAALMGFFSIPIKPSTILVFSIAFGISVDNTIHFLAKYRQGLKSTNWNISSSVNSALKEAGVSMIYTSIVLFIGFGIFIASDFGGTVALGTLVSITLLIAMLANLLLLPSLLLSLEKTITTKSFKEPLLQIFDEEEDIELNDLKIRKK